MVKIAAFTLVTLGLLSSSFASNEVYHRLFPQSVEICSLTNAKKRVNPDFFDWGHIVLVLHGACRDPQSGFPQLAKCPPSKTTDAEVVVSVNRRGKNANWIAIEGREFGFNGDAVPGERITPEVIERTKQKAIARGFYRDVEVYEASDLASEMVLAQDSLTMELGIRFGRSIQCVRMPVPENRFELLLQDLNRLNQEYQVSRNFVWNPYFNNCAHLAHNAFATLGVWPKKQTDRNAFRQLISVAVPANEPLDLLHLTGEAKLDNPLSLFKNSSFRKVFDETGWLPARPGILAEYIPMFAENDVFTTEGTKFHYFPLYETKVRYSVFAKKLQDEARYTDLKANLLYYRKTYESALKARPSAETLAEMAESSEREKFLDFSRRYYQYLESELKLLESQLAILN